MEFVITFVCGVCIGMIVGCVLTHDDYRNNSVGILRIDTSDPDGPYMFLELSKGIEYIRKHNFVILKVSTKSFIPHE